MAKVAEYFGKQLLRKYKIPVPANWLITEMAQLDEIELNNSREYVVKAHGNFKGRGKLGLVKVGLQAKNAIGEAKKMLFRQVNINGHSVLISEVLIEEKINTQKEYYLAFQSVREGTDVLFSIKGGIEIEENWDSVNTLTVPLSGIDESATKQFLKKASVVDKEIPVLSDFIKKLYDAFLGEDATYLEINPLGVTKGGIVGMDAVLMVDDDSQYRHPDWTFSFLSDLARPLTNEEIHVKNVNSNLTKGTVKFTVLNLDGKPKVALLPAGGGASVFYTDAVIRLGGIPLNYTEYSGDPAADAVFELTKIVAAQPDIHHLIVGGAIANFTDVKTTFTGIIKGFHWAREQGHLKGVKIWVRRGGPNEKAGLNMMRALMDEGFDIYVYDRNTPLTAIVNMALEGKTEFQKPKAVHPAPVKKERNFPFCNRSSKIMIYGAQGLNPARRMAEFSYLTGLPYNVVCLVDPNATGNETIPYGAETILMPTYKTAQEAIAEHPEINEALVYVNRKTAYSAAVESLNFPKIRFVSMITEGVPEMDAKKLLHLAREKGKIFNGPSAIGIFSAGECRMGVAGGSFDNLIMSRLHRPGSFGVLTKSGGLLNEIMWMLSQWADGTTTAIGIGGDSFPGSDYVTYLEFFENDPQTQAVVIIGEMGGNLEEGVAEWYSAKKRRIKVITVIAGISQEKLPKGMKFGHAGAKLDASGRGTARYKIDILKKAGVVVAPTFGDLGPIIEDVYLQLLKDGKIVQGKEPEPVNAELPKPIEDLIKTKSVVIPSLFTCNNFNKGDEPVYYGYRASDLVEKGYGIEHVIGLQLTGHLPSKAEAELIRRLILLTVDNGPCVSGALATIIASCAGIPLSQSVAAGLIMIGPRFGGAVTDAARYFEFGCKNYSADVPGFLEHMKREVGPVPGIGHRKFSKKSPDLRVKSTIGFIRENKLNMPILDFALEVEKATLTKKDNLILNVDGMMGAVLRDLGFDIEGLNGFFIIARTIGLCGHWVDQRKNNSRLIRLFEWLVHWGRKEVREVPPLES
jgi:ATP-citrate lyase alpha-subunit